MEKFLADYGLTWVGADAQDKKNKAQSPKGQGKGSNLAKEPKQQHKGEFNSKAIDAELAHQAPAYRNNVPSEIDTEVLTRRIEELNFIAEK